MSTNAVNQLRVIRSEWIKVSSLRSTWFTLGFAVLGMIGLSIAIAWTSIAFWDDMDADDQAKFDAISASLEGISLAQLVIAVLGVQIITGEYATGMIRASLAAVPRRLMLLGGKITISAVLSFVVSIPSAFAAFFIGQAILGDQGVGLGDGDALRAVLGTAFNLTAIAVLATAVGFMTRSTASGIAIILGVLLVLPVMAEVIPVDWFKDVMNFLPGYAGAAITATDQTTYDISPLAGLFALSAWIAASVIGAGILLVKRDA